MVVSILLILSLVLAACGSKDTDGESQGDSTPAPLEIEPEQLGYIKATDPSKIPDISKNRTDSVVMGMDATSGIYNPYFLSTSYDSYVTDLVIESLGSVSQDASIVPDLATWETSEDGLVWTFHIDPKATFSDGKPVTAHDAEFGFYVLLDPTYDGRTNMSVAKIVGADAYQNGDATTIEGIKVLDEKTLEITVEEASALTINYLVISVLPKHYYGEGFSKGNIAGVKAKNGAPLGSGPYIFESEVPSQEVRFEANQKYWRTNEIPKIKKVFFKFTTDDTNVQMLVAGETDFEEGISVTKDAVEMIKDYGFIDQSLLLNNGYGYISINHTLPKFQDKRVRQALTWGLDRDSIVYAYSQGYANVIDVPQSKMSWAYPDDTNITKYTYDPDRAAQLLDEAGWIMAEDGFRYKDGEKFVIHFAASTPNSVNDALIPVAVQNYKDLGIEFIPEQLEFGAVIDKRNIGDYEMAFLAVSLNVDPDPYGLFHSNSANNKEKYSNPEVDQLIVAGQKEIEQEKRKAIYNQLYQILNDDIPVIFMYQRYNMNAINSRIQGFDITPYYDFTFSLHHVYMNN